MGGTRMNNIKFKIKNIIIDSIEAKRTEFTEHGRELKRETSLSIMSMDKKTVVIQISEKFYFIPEGPFYLNMDVIEKVIFNESIQKEEVEKNLKSISEPALPVISLVVAFLTEKILSGPPIIIPPFLDEENEEITEDEENEEG